MAAKEHVVIVGGGFAGLNAAQSLKDAPVRVTVLDRRNFHLFQPLLYQVATAGLSPGDISSPLRRVLRRQKNTRVLLAEVQDIDVANRQLVLPTGPLTYDTLVVATGAHHSYFGNDHWEPLAPGLKTIEDALEMRRRILLAFEAAELEPDPEQRRAWLTFVVVGGGPTGVELAGTLAEIAKDSFRGDFRNINPENSSVLLVEGLDRVLPPYPPSLSAKARTALEELGVTVRTGTLVTGIAEGSVTVRDGDRVEQIPAHTVLWAAGVQASSLGQVIAGQTGADTDRAGRVKVQPDLTVPGRPELFVVGDLALALGEDGKPLPGTAPVAMQQGDYVAEVIKRRLKGEPVAPFHFVDKGSMATIGRGHAVAEIGRLRFSGFIAWLLWLFVHLMYLVGFENRILVFIQWAWNYVTRNRGARLITGTAGRRLRQSERAAEREGEPARERISERATEGAKRRDSR